MNEVGTIELRTASVPSAGVHPRDSLRETVESIVVALILAFVFRAFIVEAFVIPTGSMAPTLYGAHGTILCEDCGWEFAYGLQDPSEPPRPDRVEAASHAVCPNCGHRQTNLYYNDGARNAESGDRILVLKWPYDLGLSFLGPQRWDVTVFKNPSDPTQNYIKRLVGLPEEVLMIVDGDVYSAPASEFSAEALAELNELRTAKFLLQTGKFFGRMPAPSDSLMDELDKKLTIARKTDTAQAALWFPVFDNNHAPRDPGPDQPRWQPARGAQPKWTVKGPLLTFSADSDAVDYVELSPRPVVAGYAYNIPHPRSVVLQPPAVTDQRVRFALTPRSSDGAVMVRLMKHGRSFWAVIQMDGKVALVESRDPPTDAMPAMAVRQLSPFAVDRPVAVSFENLDYRLSIHVGAREILASSSVPGEPAYYGPDLKALRGTPYVQPTSPRLYGRSGSFEIRHLVVERDVHYYNVPLNQMPWNGIPGWGTAGSPILLRKGEYFMLGDNSPASQDSRLWGDITKNEYLTARGEAYQLGTVPADQLIGKAFFVYWPSGHRLPWLPVPARWQAVIPDVGRMRWIR